MSEENLKVEIDTSELEAMLNERFGRLVGDINMQARAIKRFEIAQDSLQSILVNPRSYPDKSMTKVYCEIAFAYADEMLARHEEHMRFVMATTSDEKH